jgi:hypothetical protein
MKLALARRCQSSPRLLPAALAALSLALALALGLLGPAAARADESRVLDDEGRLLSVGNWRLTRDDDGSTLRIEDSRSLSWELREADAVVGEGAVPGSVAGLVDATPALSRNPATGDILLVWSRESASGTREVVAATWRGGAFVPGEPKLLASGTFNQVDPVVLHDAAGQSFVAWRDSDWRQQITLLILTQDGLELSRKDLTADLSVRNGPPHLGVDVVGQIFVAFVGEDAATAESRVFVRSAGPRGGGVLHDPLPILDLALVSSQPLPDTLADADPTVPGVLRYPALHASVLGGTPVVWWTEPGSAGTLVFRHLAQSPETGWEGARVATFVLHGSGPDLVQQALQVLENRLRRVAVTVGTSSEVGLRLRRPGLALP